MVLLVFLSTVVYSTAFEKNYYNQHHFGEFKDIAATVDEWHQDLGSENLTQAIRTNDRNYINFYFNKIGKQYEFELYDGFNRNDFLELKNIVDKCETPYFIYAWTLMGAHTPEDIILAKYPCIIKEKKYSGLSYIALYSMDTTTGCIKENPLVVFNSDFATGKTWNFPEEYIIDTLGRKAVLLSNLEYGPTFSKPITDISGKDVSKVRISYNLLTNNPGDAQMVLSYDAEESPAYEWISTKIDYFQKDNQWFNVINTFKLPEYKSKDDLMKIYLWNVNKADIFISDIKIEFYENEY